MYEARLAQLDAVEPGLCFGRLDMVEGQRLHDIITQTGLKRSAYLLQPIPVPQLEKFLKTFDKIRRNAAAQLERERAYEELDSQ